MNKEEKTLTLSNRSYILRNGYKLAYFDSHPDCEVEQETMILIHGYCGSSAYFTSIVPLLTSQYRILVIDLFGHGQSDHIAIEPFTLEAIARYLEEWIIALKLNKVHLFGHSLGGYITLAFAEQSSEHLASFGLLHSTALPDSEEAKGNRDKAIGTIEGAGIQTFVNGLAPKLLASEVEKDASELLFIQEIGYTTAPQAAIQFAKAMQQRPDRQSVINTATIPVLLVAGAKDQIVKPEAVFAGSTSTSTCTILERAAHMGMIESSAEVAATIDSFIKGISH